MEVVRRGFGLDPLHSDRRGHLRAKFKHLKNAAGGKIRAGQAAGKANEILDLG
jgi:hypothetical protein